MLLSNSINCLIEQHQLLKNNINSRRTSPWTNLYLYIRTLLFSISNECILLLLLFGKWSSKLIMVGEDVVNITSVLIIKIPKVVYQHILSANDSMFWSVHGNHPHSWPVVALLFYRYISPDIG